MPERRRERRNERRKESQQMAKLFSIRLYNGGAIVMDRTKFKKNMPIYFKKGVNLQKNQSLFITAPIEGARFRKNCC